MTTVRRSPLPLLLAVLALAAQACAPAAPAADAPAVDVAAPATASVLAQDEGEPSDDVGLLVVEAEDIFLTRDPFEPVVTSLFAEDADTGETGGNTDGGTDGGGTDGGTSGGGTGGGGTGGGGSGGDDRCSNASSEAVCEGLVIGLTGFDEDGNALVTVGGSTVVASAGDVLADGTLLVVSVSSPCATFLYGDEGFTLCVGEQILK